MKALRLSIYSWRGVDPLASHFYGELISPDKNTEHVYCILNEKSAQAINDERGRIVARNGMHWDTFDTKEDVITAAIKIAKGKYREGFIILDRNISDIPIIIYPENDFTKKANELADRGNKHERKGEHKLSDEILLEWTSIMNKEGIIWD